MKSYGLTLCLKDDAAKIEQYKEYHRAVWPEVLEQIESAGVRQMQIFLRGTRMFMYIETDDDFDPATSWGKVNDNERGREWNRIMVDLQERAPEAGPDEWWAFMEEVFNLSTHSTSLNSDGQQAD